MTESPPRILAGIRDEAGSIGAEVAAACLPARLLGGVAFWLRCPSVRSRIGERVKWYETPEEVRH